MKTIKKIGKWLPRKGKMVRESEVELHLNFAGHDISDGDSLDSLISKLVSIQRETPSGKARIGIQEGQYTDTGRNALAIYFDEERQMTAEEKLEAIKLKAEEAVAAEHRLAAQARVQGLMQSIRTRSLEKKALFEAFIKEQQAIDEAEGR